MAIIDERAATVSAQYAVYGTMFIVLVVCIAIFSYWRNTRLNWYENNLLEIAESSSSPPHYVRCKAAPKRVDTYDDDEEAAIRSSMHQKSSTMSHSSSTPTTLVRKQSRISNIDQLRRFGAAKSSLTELPKGDTTANFTVPRAPTHSSMFQDLHENQFDRGLYQQNSTSSCEESIGCCGSLKLSITMDLNLNLLTVGLRQAVELSARRQDGLPNPYCRVALDIPDAAKQDQQQQKEQQPRYQQTRIYTNTTTPLMNDDFYFQLSSTQLNQCKLQVLVYDYDQFTEDECIGYIWLSLGRLNISSDMENPTVFWAEVLPLSDHDDGYGEMLFSLAYLSKAQRLTVNIVKARNLNLFSIEQPSIAIRVTLLTNSEKRLKRKKTSTRKMTRNPTYNESLTFAVPKNTLCDTILEFEAMHEYGSFGMAHKVLGRIDLPLHMCKELWRAIIREEKAQAKWYPILKP